MFLKSIRLTAFKCHESLVMDFSPDSEETRRVRKTTFLVGETGTGKSALLQAIAIVTGGSEVLRALPGLPDDYIQLRKRFALLEATVLNAEGEELEIAVRLVRGQSLEDMLAKNKDSLALIDALLHDPDQNYFTAGYGSGRKSDTSGKRVRQTSAAYSAISSLFGMDGLRGALLNGKDIGNMPALKQALNKVLPPEVRVKGADRNSGQLLFSTPDGTLPLDMLSRGYQQMVAWLSNLLYEISRRSTAKNPLAAQGLLLIAEIDLHLHPAWQRLIPSILKESLPNFQIIATSYSPHIAQQAGPGELYALHRDEGGKVELLPFHGDPSRMLLHQLLMSPMFGLETDESLKVERAKAAVRAAAISGIPAAAEKLSGRSITESVLKDLPDIVNTRSNSGAAAEDLSLLQAINQSLQSGKKGRSK